ncbi:MAG TPA: amidase family protein [Xanthobacteraceae bacterium]|nr:amidase family protein [Xanthobacteraceae bacterium]
MRRSAWSACFLVLSPVLALAQPAPANHFQLMEATIDSIHAAMRAGELSCTALVQAYLDRIAAYDQAGPKLNAIQSANPHALTEAARLDAAFRTSGPVGPLHCIPVLMKDEVDTEFMPTTYGSALFKTFVPPRNATIVNRLLAAGAIILAKANMGEFATAYSGSAFGDCHNAYDPRRSPSGSSCGTAVGIAANFAAVGIGEDTGGSIRGPAAHASLVGLRPTLPLVSRAGMMPFAPSRDTLGPITRTVRDAAIVLDVIAGYDPDDPITAWSYGLRADTYTRFLIPNGLSGMRLGIIRTPMARDTDVKAADYKEVQAAVSQAAADLRARGAEVIDPLSIPDLKAMVADGGGGGDTYEAETAINGFLAQFPNAPVHTLREIVESPVVIARRREELGRALGRTVDDLPAIKQARVREELRDLIVKVMADNRLDALIYATYDHAPAIVPKSTPGTNRVLASITAFPALAVPAGFFSDGLPIGIEFLGRPYSEGTLLKAAYDYEQTTRHRHPPATAPALASLP